MLHALLQCQAMPYETASSCHHKQVLRQLVLLSCILLLQALLGIAMDCLVEACRYADTCQPKHGLDKLRILHVACISVTSGRILELSRQIAALWCLQKPTSALLAHSTVCSLFRMLNGTFGDTAQPADNSSVHNGYAGCVQNGPTRQTDSCRIPVEKSLPVDECKSRYHPLSTAKLVGSERVSEGQTDCNGSLHARLS